MHNARLADADDEFTIALKELTAKRTKTAEDREAIKWIEFQGGLYLDSDGDPCIPSDCVRKCFIDAGRKIKVGSDLEMCLGCNAMDYKVQYKGPHDPKKMYDDKRFVCHKIVSAQGKKGGGKTKRTRPMFPVPWEFEAILSVNTVLVDGDVLERLLPYAGIVGIGDGRSIGMGKFTAEII